MTTFDAAPCIVTGTVEARRARVIWHDGRLHVFRSQTDVTSVEAAEPPTRKPGGWECAGATIRKAGCACGFALARVSRATLLESVTVDA